MSRSLWHSFLVFGRINTNECLYILRVCFLTRSADPPVCNYRIDLVAESYQEFFFRTSALSRVFTHLSLIKNVKLQKIFGKLTYALVRISFLLFEIFLSDGEVHYRELMIVNHNFGLECFMPRNICIMRNICIRLNDF